MSKSFGKLSAFEKLALLAPFDIVLARVCTSLQVEGKVLMCFCFLTGFKSGLSIRSLVFKLIT